MVEKPYCEGWVKLTLWVVAILFVATIVGTVYYVRLAKTAGFGEALADWGGSMSDLRSMPGPEAGSAALPAGARAQAQLAAFPANARRVSSPLALESIENQLGNVAASVRPSVVHIRVLRLAPGNTGFEARQVENIGSGVIVDSRGYILTNYHVVENPLRIFATSYAPTGPATFEATLVDADFETDLAVIQIEGAKFPAARLGDSSSLRVGDWVMAMGSPLDLAQTVSLGIVSALRGRVQVGDAVYSDLVQTDAHINKGNSGGPLVDIHGRVVGINSAIYTPAGRFTGVGFALPIDKAKPMLAELNIARQPM